MDERDNARGTIKDAMHVRKAECASYIMNKSGLISKQPCVVNL